MKFKFESNLEYQNEAISSIIDIFDGIKTKEGIFSSSWFQQQLSLNYDENIGIGNQIITANWIKNIAQENIEKIQIRNGITESSSIDTNYPTFDVEMETGTGKTYVYLKTILELNNKYKFKKFIILVPSVAIREGVKKTLEITKEHFKNIFPGLNYSWNEYDSKKLHVVWNFTTNNNIEIMIMNIQQMNNFNQENEKKVSNILYKDNDLLLGNKPIDLIKQTNPIVIIDEPQSTSSGEKSIQAIKNLNPLFILRYSATFKKRTNENLVYRLDPVEAYQKNLVKELVVYSQQLESANENRYIKLIDVDCKKLNAKIEIKTLVNDKEIKLKKVTVKQDDDLYNASNDLDEYKDLKIEEIVFEKDNEKIILSNADEIIKGSNNALFDIKIKTAQIKQTIKKHLDNQLKLKDKGVKVLSLFFIDQVKKYREYDENGNPILGQYAKIFETEFQKVVASNNEYLKLFDTKDIQKIASEIHDGYFSVDNKNRLKDTNGINDTSTYDKIMKDKEKLLSFNEKLSFIFSHSALKEGWDNPNVFQICTLNDTKSEIRKRQIIGRGLRLCVNQNGKRLKDRKINKLSIFTNESYKEFVEKLQKEFKEEGINFGLLEPYTFSKEISKNISKESSKYIFNLLKKENIITEQGKVIKNEFNQDKIKSLLEEDKHLIDLKEKDINGIIDVIKRSIRVENIIKNGNEIKVNDIKKDVIILPEFKKLWNYISSKTIYNIKFNSEDFIEKVISKIENNLSEIKKTKIISEKAHIKASRLNGFETKKHSVNDIQEIKTNDILIPIPDLISDIEKSTNITRKTIVKILTRPNIVEHIIQNHEELKKFVINIMNEVKKEMMVNGIEYKKIDNEYYEQSILEENEKEIFFDEEKYIKTDEDDKKYPFQYIYIESGSTIEKNFAIDSLDSSLVNKFIKLPNKFQIRTPLGSYNPDWALYTDDKITFVAETKGTTNINDLRKNEKLKILCGKKHFSAIDKHIKFEQTDTLRNLLLKHPKSEE